MHEIETIEGLLNVQWTDWVWADQSYLSKIRLGGYLGARTADLTAMAGGFIATSYLMQPPRVMFIKSESWDWAVHEVETAEAEGPQSSAWQQLFVPPELDEHDTINGHSIKYRPAIGPLGVVLWQVIFDGRIVLGTDGEPCVYSDWMDASFSAWCSAGGGR